MTTPTSDALPDASSTPRPVPRRARGADPADSFSTLDDFLLSLADGVTQAQEELARAGAIGPPGRQFAYHLPRELSETKAEIEKRLAA